MYIYYEKKNYCFVDLFFLTKSLLINSIELRVFSEEKVSYIEDKPTNTNIMHFTLARWYYIVNLKDENNRKKKNKLYY